MNHLKNWVEELDACVKWVWAFKKSRFELSIKNTQRKFWRVSIKKWLLITSRMQFGILIFGGSGFERTTNWRLFPLNDVVSPLRNKAETSIERGKKLFRHQGVTSKFYIILSKVSGSFLDIKVNHEFCKWYLTQIVHLQNLKRSQICTFHIA